MEVEGEGCRPTGRFRRVRLNPTSKPKGQLPSHWVDSMHEQDGYDIGSAIDNRDGEELLSNAMGALYSEAGLEYAMDDVSGAFWDPSMVHKGRGADMFFREAQRVRPSAEE